MSVYDGNEARLAGARDASATRAAVERARAFAELVGRPVLPWMLWAGWCLHVGCDECAERGPGARCYGTADCHEYENGCGCVECAERQLVAENEARGRLAA